jgi:hypothetical protein
MNFDEAMREAALRADEAVNDAMSKYAIDDVTDEPEITGVLIGQLDARFDHGQIGGLSWRSKIVRNGKGVAAEEKRVGADLLIHVQVTTPTQSYSKGVLIQAKRAERDEAIADLPRLQGQCLTMLSHTAAAFVFVYAKGYMRCGSATRFSGTSDARINRQATWRSYRFFLELFRCPIGDPNITSSRVSDLPVPKIIRISAES